MACVQLCASDDFLRHPDSDVRLWDAKCLIEGLRIFAPEPPFDARCLRTVLELFLEQLGALLEPGNAAFVHAVGLLEQIAEVRAFILVFDCEDPADILLALVSICLRAARSGHCDHFEGLISKVLICVLGEADEIPSMALASLVDELGSAHRTPNAVNVARCVLDALAKRSVAVGVGDFLIDRLYMPLKSVDDVEGGTVSHQGPVLSLFRAVYELFVIDPFFIARVLPNLQADLQCEDPDRRCVVTELVGKMLSHHAPTGNRTTSEPPLFSTHPLLLDRYFARYDDADERVRLAALDSCGALICTASAATPGDDSGGAQYEVNSVDVVSASLRARQHLADRALDPSDVVRLRVIEVASEVASSAAGLQLLAPALPDVFRRIFDKKPRVREACLEVAAQLYAEHALPKPMSSGGSGSAGGGGSSQDNDEPMSAVLAFVPQLLCEAYPVFASGRLGLTAQLEESIERCVLGCGDALDATQRARSLARLCASVVGHEAATRGLALLLARKRDAHMALRRFLRFRLARGAPMPEVPDVGSGSLVLCSDDGAPRGGGAAEAAASLEALARFSPAMEDRGVQPQMRLATALAQLRSLDAVRDRALWLLLDRLSCPAVPESTKELAPLLGELDRLLRVHHVTELGPLLRRALLSTWLLPDQVSALLTSWASPTGGSGDIPLQVACTAARQAAKELPKYFPGVFAPHVESIMQRICTGRVEIGVDDSSSMQVMSNSAAAANDASIVPHTSAAFSAIRVEDARVVLRMLASLGKWSAASTTDPDRCSTVGGDALDTNQFVQTLLQAPVLAASGSAQNGSFYRQAVRALGLLSARESQRAVEQILEWADENSSGDGQNTGTAASTLQFAAACLGKRVGGLGHPDSPLWGAQAREMWLEVARGVLQSGSGAPLELSYSALELCAAIGVQEDFLVALDNPKSQSIRWRVDVVACSLRAMRHGVVPVTTIMLARLAEVIASALAQENNLANVEVLLNALQKIDKPGTAHLRLFNRLRLCGTLLAVFALAPGKRERERGQRTLQNLLAKVVHQSASRQEPLLDLCIACFIHFLSRNEEFIAEAAVSTSAFPTSSRIAFFFAEALLRNELHGNTEIAGVVLRVVDRVRYFVDRECPESDAVHKAAHVLRYVVEKQFPQLGAHGVTLLQGASEGSMPAELFAVAPVASAASLEHERGVSMRQSSKIAIGATETADESAENAATTAIGRPIDADDLPMREAEAASFQPFSFRHQPNAVDGSISPCGDTTTPEESIPAKLFQSLARPPRRGKVSTPSKLASTGERHASKEAGPEEAVGKIVCGRLDGGLKLPTQSSGAVMPSSRGQGSKRTVRSRGQTLSLPKAPLVPTPKRAREEAEATTPPRGGQRLSRRRPNFTPNPLPLATLTEEDAVTRCIATKGRQQEPALASRKHMN